MIACKGKNPGFTSYKMSLTCFSPALNQIFIKKNGVSVDSDMLI